MFGAYTFIPVAHPVFQFCIPAKEFNFEKQIRAKRHEIPQFYETTVIHLVFFRVCDFINCAGEVRELTNLRDHFVHRNLIRAESLSQLKKLHSKF